MPNLSHGSREDLDPDLGWRSTLKIFLRHKPSSALNWEDWWEVKEGREANWGPAELLSWQSSEDVRRWGRFSQLTQTHHVQRLTSALANSRACSWSGKTAAPPNLTSITRADSPSTAFLLRMEAVGGGRGMGSGGARPYDSTA